MTDRADEKDEPLSADARFAVSSGVYVRPFGDELVLLEFGTGDYFGLDPIAAEVWQSLARDATIGDIADAVVRRWDTTSEEALRDVRRLLAHMLAEGLVVPKR